MSERVNIGLLWVTTTALLADLLFVGYLMMALER